MNTMSNGNGASCWMSTGARAAEESLSICMRVAKAQNYPDTSCPTLPLRLRGRCSQPTDESATDENGGNQRAQLVDAVAVGGCAWWVPQPPARACPQAPHCPTPAPTASKRAGTLHWERRRRPPAGTVASTLRSSLACPRRQSRRCDRDKNDCRRRRRGGRNSRRYHHHHHLCPGVSRPPPPPSTGRCVHACRALRPARRRRPPTPPTAIHLRPQAPPAHAARCHPNTASCAARRHSAAEHASSFVPRPPPRSPEEVAGGWQAAGGRGSRGGGRR